MRYRVNGKDSTIPRFVTVGFEVDSPTEAVAWAKRFTVFKPHSDRVVMNCLQVWDNKIQQWRWVAREA